MTDCPVNLLKLSGFSVSCNDAALFIHHLDSETLKSSDTKIQDPKKILLKGESEDGDVENVDWIYDLQDVEVDTYYADIAAFLSTFEIDSYRENQSHKNIDILLFEAFITCVISLFAGTLSLIYTICALAIAQFISYQISTHGRLENFFNHFDRLTHQHFIDTYMKITFACFAIFPVVVICSLFLDKFYTCVFTYLAILLHRCVLMETFKIRPNIKWTFASNTNDGELFHNYKDNGIYQTGLADPVTHNIFSGVTFKLKELFLIENDCQCALLGSIENEYKVFNFHNTLIKKHTLKTTKNQILIQVINLHKDQHTMLEISKYISNITGTKLTVRQS
jgi:hypothetical protein